MSPEISHDLIFAAPTGRSSASGHRFGLPDWSCKRSQQAPKRGWIPNRSGWLPLQLLLMADSPYLLAIALFEQNGKRAMPLGGRSLPKDVTQDERGVPAQLASELAFELLLRVWQRSDQGPVQREAAPGSLLLAELGMEHLPEDLPLLKAAWLTTGDSPAFRRGLLAITSRCWSVSVAKFEPIAFTALEVSASQAEG